MRQLHPQPATSVSIAVCVGDWGVIFRRHRRYRYTDDTLCCTEYRVVSDYSVRAMLKLNKHRVCLGWHRTCVFLASPALDAPAARVSVPFAWPPLLVACPSCDAPCALHAGQTAGSVTGRSARRTATSLDWAGGAVRERAGEPACGQAASIGQKATRNSAEQIEKEQRTTAARA